MDISINPSKFFMIKNSENINISYKKVEDIYKGIFLFTNLFFKLNN